MASMQAANAAEQEKVVQFMSVTGADNERALFYLQAAAWNVESALSAFFDNSEPSHGSGASMPVQDTQPPDPSAIPEHPPLPMEEVQPPPQKGGRGFMTLSDYQDRSSHSPSEEKGQEFFAGGSEHSGQVIEGPPRKKLSPESIAKKMFESAKEQGAVSLEDEEEQKKKKKSAAFRGSGFKLGDTEGPSVHIPGGQPPPSPEMVRFTITFWKDGFSIDDGELRRGESEADKAFLKSVTKGEIPLELVRFAKGGEVDLVMKDRRTETYVKPKQKMVAFSGEGRKLGGLAPDVISQSAPPPSTSAPSDPPTVPLDPTQPTTSVQIRLADGSRLVAKFNHTHTVNDIRQYINICRPSSSTYTLMTTFPKKELTDPTQTLAEASLLNAVVVQRMK